jgi:hypothetical protein
LPDGLIFRNRVKPSLEKYFAFSEARISRMVRPIPCSPGGALRDRHERGAGCDGRDGFVRRTKPVADGKIVWSRSPDAGIKFAEDIRQVTVANKPDTGESAL